MLSIKHSYNLALERVELAKNTLGCLANLIQENGEFVYKFEYDTKTRLQGYNVLRHCGSIWALNSAGFGDFDFRTHRAVDWLLKVYTKRSPDGQLCIATDKKVKLGAAALAAVALSTLPQRVRTQYFMTIGEICNYITTQWSEQNGDFYHCLELPSWMVTDFRSDYYTGQALLALLLAEEMGIWSPQSSKSMNWTLRLAKNRYGIAAQSHWMMYAVAAAFRAQPSTELLGYAIDFIDGIFDNNSYAARRQCTPIACRSEAVAQFIAVAASVGKDWEHQRVRRAVDLIEENFEMQLNDYRSDGAFICGGGRTHVRIDYLQHNAMAMIEYARSLKRYIFSS
ncbi:hypothetical protein [Rhizobium rhizogenes]|uniref:hypothetical protein n=1 Tax=Rhizobium rhizogenes TaxID=359 RepID=UPI001573FB42|nr:hypothetical protein [Rhizobium rhizogenes]NTH23021.1 hypothetical protein [Rhizobium rhizogenes]NTH36051.1 hypothetical protein [Rhizobium rhizogenes]